MSAINKSICNVSQLTGDMIRISGCPLITCNLSIFKHVKFMLNSSGYYRYYGYKYRGNVQNGFHAVYKFNSVFGTFNAITNDP